MNSINKIFSLCIALACFVLAYKFYPSSNIPEGMFDDPNTGKPMLLGEVLIDELKQEPFAEWYNATYDTDLPITGENFVTFEYWRQARYPEDWNIEEFPDFETWYGAPD